MIAKVPVFVMGEPDTENPAGTVCATLLTVPPPVPGGVAHVPSPRQKVVDDAAVPLFRFVTGKLPWTQLPPVASCSTCAFHVPDSPQPGENTLYVCACADAAKRHTAIAGSTKAAKIWRNIFISFVPKVKVVWSSEDTASC